MWPPVPPSPTICSPAPFPLCPSPVMIHISQSDRVMVGLDGNLYFSNLLQNDSRKDYMCNAQYLAARTILTESAISLMVLPSESKP